MKPPWLILLLCFLGLWVTYGDRRLARTRVDLQLLICGEIRHAKTNVCIIDQSHNFLLLVREDKKLKSGEHVDVQAQLVAKAIGAFNENNANREAAGLAPLVEKVSHFASLLTFF
jgi:hypothetical protein